MKNSELKALLNQMTIEEKLGQLTQLTGDHFVNAEEFAEELVETGPSYEDMGLTKETLYTIGSVLGVSSAKVVNEIQRNYLNKNRLGIPLLFMHDAIHGYRTTFPIPLAVGCSFDRNLAKTVAKDTAIEMRAAGIHVNFSPMADLVRDARWGRVLESYGEDAVVSGEIGRAMIEGYQNEEAYVSACLKHFAAYGAPDAGRDYASVDMSNKEFFGFYARPYELALKADPDFVMSSFNSLNGEPVTASSYLLKEVLREEFGFKNILISDWSAVAELKNHGVAQDDKIAGELALKAGVDIEMVSTSYLQYGEEIVNKNPELIKQIDAAVLKILELKNRFGLFENPYVDETSEKQVIRNQKIIEDAYKVAKASQVLLKNDDQILPLNPDEKVLLIGPFAKTQELLGNWMCKGKFNETISVEEGLKSRNIDISAFESLDEVPEILLAEVDQVVVTLGESWDLSGEGHSSIDIEISSEQVEMIKQLKKRGKHLIALVFAGRPLALENVVDQLDAILYTWFLGNEAGNAIADLLLGNDTPSGKLPMSLPRKNAQTPLRYNELRSGRPANESSYSSRYQDLEVGPLFPFGHGLSYANLNYQDYELDQTELSADQAVTLTFTIVNSSDYEINETVLVFIQDLVSNLVRPVRELIHFDKIKLEAHSSKQYAMKISLEDVKYIDNHGKSMIENGEIEIYVNDLRTKVASLIVASD